MVIAVDATGQGSLSSRRRTGLWPDGLAPQALAGNLMMAHVNTPRPLGHVHDVRRRYPHAFDQMREFRREKGRGLPDWPDWCWVPVAGAYAVVSGGGSGRVAVEAASDISIVGSPISQRFGTICLQ